MSMLTNEMSVAEGSFHKLEKLTPSMHAKNTPEQRSSNNMGSKNVSHTIFMAAEDVSDVNTVIKTAAKGNADLDELNAISERFANHAREISSVHDSADSLEEIKHVTLPLKRAGLFASLFERGHLAEDTSFFDKLGVCPNLEDVSLSCDEEQSSSGEVFVDSLTNDCNDPSTRVSGYPLSGDVIDFDEEEDVIAVEQEEILHDGEEILCLKEEFSEDDELLVLLELEKDEEIPRQLKGEVLLENFLGTEMGKSPTIDKVDWKKQRQIEHMNQLNIIAKEFMDQLILYAVKQSEHVDRQELLRKTLDKCKIIENIENLIRELQCEQRMRLFLNRKAVDYFWRKHNFLAISDDDAKDIKPRIAKLEEITNKLCDLLEREENLKAIEKGKIAFYKLQLENLKVSTKEKEDDFAILLNKTFNHSNLRHLRTVIVPWSLNQMSAMRKEISDVWLELIQRQHTKAIITQKIKDFERIGNGLYTTDYEILKSKVLKLERKVKECNEQMKRYGLHCKKDIQLRTHFSEKSQWLRNHVQNQRLTLDHLKHNRIEERKRLLRLKLTQKSLRRDIEESQFQCGLLDKPALLLDYNATEQKIMEAQQRVVKLREEYDNMERKIDKLNKKFVSN